MKGICKTNLAKTVYNSRAIHHHFEFQAWVSLPDEVANDNEPCGTTLATTRPCGELWLVKGCPHIGSWTLLHQPQLVTLVNCGQCCATLCGTRIFLFLEAKSC